MRGWINIVTSYLHSQQYLVRGDYIVTSYFHYRQYLVREWLHHDIVFSFPTIFGQGVNISWHIFIPHNIWWRGEYIVTLYFHSPQYLVRGELIYRDPGSWLILIPRNIWWGVIISWHYIFIPHNIWWQVIISWHYILTPDNIWWGVIISWHDVFTPDNIWWGGDYILTLNFHPWQYLVRGWLYRDIIFSLLTIFSEGMIISWHYVFTPDNIWWGGDYIVTLYFHSWQYLVRGDYIVTSSFTPENIWWGGDFIGTSYFHPWQ